MRPRAGLVPRKYRTGPSSGDNSTESRRDLPAPEAQPTTWSLQPQAFPISTASGSLAPQVQAASDSNDRFAGSIHPLIEREARPQFLIGRYELGVFAAMKAVEVRVRRLGGLANQAVGVDLMNKAFGPTGRLTDRSPTKGKREGMRALFHLASTVPHVRQAFIQRLGRRSGATLGGHSVLFPLPAHRNNVSSFGWQPRGRPRGNLQAIGHGAGLGVRRHRHLAAARADDNGGEAWIESRAPGRRSGPV